MSDLWFNYKHETHHLRLIPVDYKPDDIIVWQATTDHSEYTYFEAYDELEIWELMELAIAAYRVYRADNTITGLKWREGTSYE